MRRREFITLLGGAAARGRSRRVRSSRRSCRPSGSCAATPSAWHIGLAAFVQRLRELGWIEGRNRRDRVSLGGGTQRAICRDRGRVRPAQSRCHRHGRTPHGLAAKRATSVIPIVFASAGDPVGQRRWSPVWRGRAATSPACRTRRPISAASDWSSCARLSPASPVGVMANVGQSRCRAGDGRGSGSGPYARASRSASSKSGKREEIAPAFETLEGARTHFMSAAEPLVNSQPGSHQHLGAGRATADDLRLSGVRRSGRSDVLWTKHPGPVPARRRLCR